MSEELLDSLWTKITTYFPTKTQVINALSEIESNIGVDSNLLFVEVAMSDDDDTDLSSVAATISVNSGAATAMTGKVYASRHVKLFTIELQEDDTFSISFNTINGYSTPTTITGTKGSEAMVASVCYNTTIHNVFVSSNQTNDSTIMAKTATLSYSYGGQTITKTGLGWDTTAVKIPTTGATNISVTADNVTNYTKTITKIGTTYKVEYNTTLLTLKMVSYYEQDATDVSTATANIYDNTTPANPVLLHENVAQGGKVKIPLGTPIKVVWSEVNPYTKPEDDYITYTNATLDAVATHIGAYTADMWRVYFKTNQSTHEDIANTTIRLYWGDVEDNIHYQDFTGAQNGALMPIAVGGWLSSDVYAIVNHPLSHFVGRECDWPDFPTPSGGTLRSSYNEYDNSEGGNELNIVSINYETKSVTVMLYTSILNVTLSKDYTGSDVLSGVTVTVQQKVYQYNGSTQEGEWVNGDFVNTGTGGITNMKVPSFSDYLITTSNNPLDTQNYTPPLPAFVYFQNYNVTGNISLILHYTPPFVDLGLPSGTLWSRGDICKDAQGNYFLGNPANIESDPYETPCIFSFGNTDGHRFYEIVYGDIDYTSSRPFTVDDVMNAGTIYCDYDEVNDEFGYTSSQYSYYDLENFGVRYVSMMFPSGVPEELVTYWQEKFANSTGTHGMLYPFRIESNGSTYDLSYDDDAAWHHFGYCRMPTSDEITELVLQTNNYYVSDFNNTGVPGWKFEKSDDSSVFIFIPMVWPYEQFMIVEDDGSPVPRIEGGNMARLLSSDFWHTIQNGSYQSDPFSIGGATLINGALYDSDNNLLEYVQGILEPSQKPFGQYAGAIIRPVLINDNYWNNND